jgi:cation diffusion facilitator family transporter
LQDTSEREKIGKKASYVAIFGNILLTIFNLTIGLLSGSTALVAEGFHTLSDVLTSIIAFIGFKIGMRPADEEHQYGHGRAEPIVGLIIVVFLGIVAFEILSSVYSKIVLGGAIVPPDWIAAVMALIGIFVNYTMTTYLIRSGKKINSPALIADGNHQKVDIFSCAAVLIGVVGSQFGFPILDPLVGVLIALFIINTAFHVARDNINTLMGKIPSKQIIEDIEKSALKSECVKGVHDIKINNMGSYASAELHIELNKELKLEKAHKIAHEVEQKIINEVEPIKMVTVHTDPKEVVCKKE